MHSTKETIRTCEAFKYHWRVWKYGGLIPMQSGPDWKRKYYMLYSAFINLTVTILFPITLLVNCFFCENIEDLCESLYLTIADVICNVKIVNIFFVHNQLSLVHPILDHLDARANTQEEKQILQDGINTVVRFFKIILFFFTVTYLTSPLVSLMSDERILMYPEWLPWNWKHTLPKYTLAFLYQVYALFFQTWMTLANDTFPQAYLSIVTTHIRTLSVRLRNIGNNQQQQQDGDDHEQQERNYRELVDCIKDHKTIIDLIAKVQKPISNTCLAQFVCTGLSQCTTAVYLLYVSDDFSRVFNAIFIFSAVTVETLILCYNGELLIQECENLSVEIYSCNWPDQNLKFKKAILQMLHRSQEINIIMAGKLIPVNLTTFLQVVKTAYSVFALLNELK